MMMKRRLGRSDVEVSAIGLGCWAIGGPHSRGGRPIGWGQVDDRESLRAIQRALELGVDFFDTADVYGCGHSERLLGKALAGVRGRVVIATKFGYLLDEESRESTGESACPDYVRKACEASLGRLRSDFIDLYQFHLGNCGLDEALRVRDVLEELVAEGKIRFYGWSTDSPQRARLFAEGPHCAAIQLALNVLGGNLETLKVCEESDLACIIRGPLCKGMLSGKYGADVVFPSDDVRQGWNAGPEAIARMKNEAVAIRDALACGGRTPAQGALAWLLARSRHTIPIPGFKSVAQVEENVATMNRGPLPDVEMDAIDAALAALRS